MLLWVELCDIIDTIEKWYEDGFSSDIPNDVKDKVSDLYECCLSYKNEN